MYIRNLSSKVLETLNNNKEGNVFPEASLVDLGLTHTSSVQPFPAHVNFLRGIKSLTLSKVEEAAKLEKEKVR